jgi:class 3 adenylate cyclase
MSQTRRLAAILAADVAGYSRLMGADEGGTLERLKGLRRELLDRNFSDIATGPGWTRWLVAGKLDSGLA